MTARDPAALRSALRTDLVTAMKAREAEVVSALRSAIAAIDNAEAIEVEDATLVASSDHVAGASVGAGSSEAERRVLTLDDIRAVLRAEIEGRIADADQYDAHNRSDAADQLRREAATLTTYL